MKNVIGSVIVPLYESKAVVTSIWPYRGKYKNWFTYVVNYTYVGSGLKSGMAVDDHLLGELLGRAVETP